MGKKKKILSPFQELTEMRKKHAQILLLHMKARGDYKALQYSNRTLCRMPILPPLSVSNYETVYYHVTDKYPESNCKKCRSIYRAKTKRKKAYKHLSIKMRKKVYRFEKLHQIEKRG